MAELFTSLMLGLHLLAVNVAAAGPLVCLWLRRRGLRGDALADAAGQRLAWWAFWGLLAGVVLGGVSLACDALSTDERYYQAFTHFPRKKLYFAAAEVLCSLVWSGLYAGLWHRWVKHPWWHAALAVLTASNLLYHFPPLWSAMALASSRPELLETLQQQSTIQWMKNPEIASRTVHVWLASLAVTGVTLMAIAAGCGRRLQDEAGAKRLVAAGARWALGPTLLQLFVGLWTLLVLPGKVQSTLMGEDLLGTLLFGTSVLGALALMHVLAAVAMGECDSRRIRQAMIFMSLIVVLMSGTLRRVRHLEAGALMPVVGVAVVPVETKNLTGESLP